MKLIFAVTFITTLLSNCNNPNIPAAPAATDSNTKSTIPAPKTPEEFKAQLLKADSFINPIQMQFQIDTFTIESNLNSALGPSHKDDILGSARLNAMQAYLDLADSLSKAIAKAMNSDSVVYNAEKKAWWNYYFKIQETISTVDDDKYLGLGSDYASAISKDLLLAAKHRAIIDFTRLKRVNGISE